ncbi:DUF4097 family beta strand repeat-containing protein [Streptomyces sp. NPDC048507]|uniref:DUF4097 family beta strand repeat-containing protein n=1 Tax=Streptomyces sp. NPDC048507 TaxID=3365560 RepID=UPI00372380A1
MHTFVTPAPLSAVIDIPAGHIRLMATGGSGTTVEVLPADASRNRDVEAAGRTTVGYADGVLRIAAPSPKGNLVGRSGSVKVTVHLPAGSRVEAKLAAGGFRGVGRLGDLTFEGAQGTVEVDESAAAHLTLLAGDIAVGRLGGPAQISTQKGDITVAEAVAGTVTLRTEAGDLSIGAAAGVSASMDAGTSYGRIRNTLKNTDGAPGLTIRASTSYGDITARSL